MSVLPTCELTLTGKDKLSKSSADEKWDRVKIVCTQPYNKVTFLYFSPVLALTTGQYPIYSIQYIPIYSISSIYMSFYVLLTMYSSYAK